MTFIPFPKLRTNRLHLRQLKESDASEVLFLRSDTTVNTFVERPNTNTIEEAIKFIHKINTGIEGNDWIFWAITVNDSPELIGTICLWNFSEDRKVAEIGYDLHPKFHNQGIMNEALTHIITYGFENLKLNTIEAFTHRDNEASKKLLLKNNFNHIEYRKDNDNPNNIIFSVSRDDKQ